MGCSLSYNAQAEAEIDESSGFAATVDRPSLIAASREQLDFLAQLILTDIYSYGYPPVFQAVWQMLCDAAMRATGKPKYAIGIPRGFAKTILLKLYCVWCILFTERRFILIICNTEKLAFNFLSDVAEMLNSPNIKLIFGDWKIKIEMDNASQKVFHFRGRTINLAAVGSGGSLRGLNLRYVRPDVVIMDDMQSREEAQNPEVAKEKLLWMLGTLMKACHPQKCVFIFVGNMYPFEGSILRKLKHSSEWVSFITGAILADGDSIWPEHRTTEDLLLELKSDTDMGHPELFFSEVMNDEESGTVSGIDVSKIPACPDYLVDASAQGGYVIIDPSLARKKSDDVGIGAYLIHDGIPVLRELKLDKFNPGKCIEVATQMAIKYHIQLIVVEAVAYQATLVYWFNVVYAQLGITGINVGEISPEGVQKNARIRDSLKDLLAGKWLVHKDARSAYIYQVTQWNPLKTNNKDEALDIGAYNRKPLEMYPDWTPLLINDDWQNNEDEAGSHTDDLQLAF